MDDIGAAPILVSKDVTTFYPDLDILHDLPILEKAQDICASFPIELLLCVAELLQES